MTLLEGRLSSRDLIGHVNCQHLTQLEIHVKNGTLKRPKPWDPSLEALWERGLRHEREFVQLLADQGNRVATIDGVAVDDAAVESTVTAMKDGVDVIVQAALRSGDWIGRADVLRRVEVPSQLGAWSYEPYDTKLSRNTNANTILQLCIYAELLGGMQGIAPEHMHVVTPWSDFLPQSYRVADFAAYYRHVKRGLADTITAGLNPNTYPDPKAHCDICAWRAECDARRRADDHLSLVAGISSLQIAELVAHDISTVAALGAMQLPLPWQPERCSRQGFARVREQARLQIETRETGELRFELLPIEAGFGLAALPEPSSADIYLDFEGDSFVGEHGQEYLLGYAYHDASGALVYKAHWGLTREDEKRAFETFIDFVMKRWAEYPGMHIYHYAPYEPGALKRLMGRFATKEDELDRILRGLVMVDLLAIVRHAIRAGVESYSIKRLEPLYGYERVTNLPDANLALTRLQTALELGDIEDISSQERDIVESYNRDDCVSTWHLHRWLSNCDLRQSTAGTKYSGLIPAMAHPTKKLLHGC